MILFPLQERDTSLSSFYRRGQINLIWDLANAVSLGCQVYYYYYFVFLSVCFNKNAVVKSVSRIMATAVSTLRSISLLHAEK